DMIPTGSAALRSGWGSNVSACGATASVTSVSSRVTICSSSSSSDDWLESASLRIVGMESSRYDNRLARWSVCLAGVHPGGTGAPKRFVECPLPIEDQQQAVLEIVPPGTSRDDSERQLATAGLEFSRGGNGSIYYLTIWNRPNGEHWHMNVALLFDSAGTLY